ncbi:MAG TPA: hypothetical protein VMM18_04205 [Gemmatimonadaceae bacterium]|nr:hypothetical protein [Gemmatimonadaceae bacterium]
MADGNWRFALRGILILALTLIAGVAAGFAMDRTVIRRGEHKQAGRTPAQLLGDRGPHGRFEAMLFARLDLSPSQRARIDSALERGRRETDAYWARVEPGLRAIVDSTRAEIQATLTASQRARYDSLRAERRRSRERDREGERQREREREAARPARPR